MAENSIPQSSPPGSGGNPPPQPHGVWLTQNEWQEICDCASGFFAAFQCYQEGHDEAWELIVSVYQRFQRALAPINERLSDQVHTK